MRARAAAAVSAESLAERAWRELEARIVTLALPPGSVLSEAALAAELGLGRTPVREALLRLAGDGLVVILPRRGTVVTDIHVDDQLMVLETRRVLDRLMASAAARRIGPGLAADLTAAASDMAEAASSGDLGRFMRADRTIDALVEEACLNRHAARANAPLHAQCRRFWVRHHRPGDLARSAACHGAIAAAIADGDEAAASAASDALIDHMTACARAALAGAA